MLSRFFSVGTGKDPLGYLFRPTDHTGKPRRFTPRLMKGDPERFNDVIRGISAESRYDSGVVCWSESKEDVGDSKATEVIEDHDRIMREGLDPRDTPETVWVMHVSSRGGLELHHVTPKRHLRSGKQLSWYSHRRDKNLLRTWADTWNLPAAWTSPNDRSRRRLSANPDRWWSEEQYRLFHRLYEDGVCYYRSGIVKDREQLVQVFREDGFRILSFDNISVTVADAEGIKIRLRGRMFSVGFVFARYREEQVIAADRRKVDLSAAIESNRVKFERALRHRGERFARDFGDRVLQPHSRSGPFFSRTISRPEDSPKVAVPPVGTAVSTPEHHVDSQFPGAVDATPKAPATAPHAFLAATAERTSRILARLDSIDADTALPHNPSSTALDRGSEISNELSTYEEAKTTDGVAAGSSTGTTLQVVTDYLGGAFSAMGVALECIGTRFEDARRTAGELVERTHAVVVATRGMEHAPGSARGQGLLLAFQGGDRNDPFEDGAAREIRGFADAVTEFAHFNPEKVKQRSAAIEATLSEIEATQDEHRRQDVDARVP